jgi:hypothetical protein
MVYVGARRVAEAIVSCQLVDTARGRSEGADGVGASADTDEPE